MNKSVILTTLLLFLSFSCSTDTLASTIISGNIEGDTTWTLPESPYLVTESINFGATTPGATLTIEPGVVVEFEPSVTFNIFGNLLAKGTQDLKITLKSKETNGNWRLNIFDSLNNELDFVINESLQGAIATYNSTVNVDHVISDSKLMLFDGLSNIKNLDLSNNQLYIGGGTAMADQLNINGGSSSFYETSISLKNATISHTNSLPAILVSDASANLENIYIDDASHGIIASNVPNLNVNNANIKNISEDGLNFSGEIANLNEITIENAYYGAGLQGSTIGLTNFNVSNTVAPSLQTSGEETSITDSSFTNGQNIGISMDGRVANLSNVTIKNFANAPAFLPDIENLQGSRLVITDNLFGVYNYGSSTIKQSKIANNTVAGALNAGEFLDARENYWGHSGGPTLDPTNPDTVHLGDGIIGDVLYEPWLTEYCESDCHSNIMFLPGIMSSRLYEDGEQLWEPNVLTEDSEFEPLYLDESGKTINEIYTKDILDNGYAYGKLVTDLANLKTQGTINNYEAVPYDWRLSIEDILNTGIKREDGSIIYGTDSSEPYIESALRRLAANSKTGKVTIIAHSNGGLVTKALINKLGDEAPQLIDKIIFVAVPQLGTPQAIGSLLQGYDAGLPDIYPFILSPERARDLAINMPMIYQLLPFADYYNNDGELISTPYVTFEDGSATQPFIEQYGYSVTPGELYDFLTGAEGRTTASFNDLDNPINANAALLSNAESMQQEINSSWQPPVGIEVYQIAGVGEDTLAGITYQTIQKCVAYTILFNCTNYEDALSYKPKIVLDGDGTVVVPSALAMSDSNENVERWWLNLKDYNGITPSFFREDHSDILEIDELRDFIFNNLIRDELSSIPNFISTTVPELKQEKRLTFTLHSPLSLGAIDEYGNVANSAEVTIPGANYHRYGEVQVITIPTGSKFTLVLTGEDEGSFTLEMEEFDDNELIASSSFSAIPSGTSTIATMTFPDGRLGDTSTLQIDYNADLIVDVTYTPILGEAVTTPNPLPTSPEVNQTISTGGRAKPAGQVLGASTDSDNLVQIIAQLQIAIITLDSLRHQISEKQYMIINSQLQTISNTVVKLLQQKIKRSEV